MSWRKASCPDKASMAAFDQAGGCRGRIEEPSAEEVIALLVAGVLADPVFAGCNRETLAEVAENAGRALCGDAEAALYISATACYFGLSRFAHPVVVLEVLGEVSCFGTE